MEISQLNLRGRMAYGLHCVLAFMKDKDIEADEYKDEIDILSQFTSAENLADWDAKTKQFIYEKYSDEMLESIIPSLFDKLYWIGASELFGKPSNCRESENLLRDIIMILTDKNVPMPDIHENSKNILNFPVSAMDFFGEPFVFKKL